MVREIKFRGQTLDGEWVLGTLTILKKKSITNEVGYYISNSVGMPFGYQVKPETVGEWIGVSDRKGKNIYEGDVLKCHNKSPHTKEEWWFPIYEVKWDKIEFTLKHLGGGKSCGSWYLPLTNWNEMQVVGNVYEKIVIINS